MQEASESEEDYADDSAELHEKECFQGEGEGNKGYGFAWLEPVCKQVKQGFASEAVLGGK